MKTSILISSFAALCLLVTFAEAPRRHGELKMNTASKENITIPLVISAAMLPGTIITADRKKESLINPVGNTTVDFSYLKFDVFDYLEADAVNSPDAELLTKSIETDYNYLKFDVNNYLSDSELNVGELPAMPVNEAYASELSVQAPALIGFEYLRFDVSKYMNNNVTENEGFGELPMDETEIIDTALTIRQPDKTDQFGYLKFDVNKYLCADSLTYIEELELPE
jgi:hypothetical protein